MRTNPALDKLCHCVKSKTMINFTELYNQTADKLLNFGIRFTSDRELVKDCVQDVFVKLYTKRGELDTIVNLESYLFVSLRNRLNDEFRHNSHLSEDEIDPNTMIVIDDNADTMMLGFEDAGTRRTNTVHDNIKCLSPRQKQIIDLFYIEQRKYDDICRIMGINYQSVRNLMHRSMTRLRSLSSKAMAV